MSETECTRALRAFLNGEFREWPGLPKGCTRAHAEAVFGPTGEAPDAAGRLGDQLTALRRYPASGIAPHGIMVWLEGDEVVLLQINEPVLLPSLDRILGEPEARAPSQLRTRHTQWIYASRGLVAHVRNIPYALIRLYGMRPTTVERFLDSPLSRVSSRRIQLNW